MNGKELLMGIGGIGPEFYEEAEHGTIRDTTGQRKTRRFKNLAGKIFIAAAIASALTVTASAAGMDWFQRYFEGKSKAPLSQQEAEFLSENQQTISESQTRDGYTLTLKSAISDGRTAYIHMGITAPQGQVLSKTVIPGYSSNAPYIGAGNVNPDFFVPAQGNQAGGRVKLATLEDYDGQDNTQDWLLTVEKIGETPIAPGSTWKLHIEDLVATYQKEGEGQSSRVKLAEGVWDFEITFRQRDEGAVECIQEPVVSTVWLGVPDERWEEVKVTSLTLSAFGAVICADTKNVPEFCPPDENRYVQVVMEDGSRVRLRPSFGISGLERLEAERPILLDHVDHVLLTDGTRIPVK